MTNWAEYDDPGNMKRQGLSDPDEHVFDAWNRVTSVDRESSFVEGYEWNGLGQLVQKLDENGSPVRDYHYGASGELFLEGLTWHAWGAQGSRDYICSGNSYGVVFFYVQDAEGEIVTEVFPGGSLHYRFGYDISDTPSRISTNWCYNDGIPSDMVLLSGLHYLRDIGMFAVNGDMYDPEIGGGFFISANGESPGESGESGESKEPDGACCVKPQTEFVREGKLKYVGSVKDYLPSSFDPTAEPRKGTTDPRPGGEDVGRSKWIFGTGEHKRKWWAELNAAGAKDNMHYLVQMNCPVTKCSLFSMGTPGCSVSQMGLVTNGSNQRFLDGVNSLREEGKNDIEIGRTFFDGPYLRGCLKGGAEEFISTADAPGGFGSTEGKDRRLGTGRIEFSTEFFSDSRCGEFSICTIEWFFEQKAADEKRNTLKVNANWTRMACGGGSKKPWEIKNPDASSILDK